MSNLDDPNTGEFSNVGRGRFNLVVAYILFGILLVGCLALEFIVWLVQRVR